jgi:glycosyltransferase involved in cell wall biosynthesis
MRILLICERINGKGGWYTYTRDHRDALQAQGHEVTICCRKGAETDALDILPAPLRCLTFLPSSFFAAQKLKKVIKHVQPDVIHITVEPYALLVPFLPKEMQAKTVLTIHGSYGIRTLKYFQTRWLAKKYYTSIPKFITVSSFTKQTVADGLRKRGIEKAAAHFEEHATVIHNGIHLPPTPVATDRNPSRRDYIKNILHVGGVKPLKGVLEAIEACAVYRDRYETAFTFQIIGDLPKGDAYVQKLKQRITELGLDSQIELRGFVSDEELISAYQQSDLYLMPSRTSGHTFEGFGLVYLEANAYGTPVIGPNTSGAAEAIEEGTSGFQVDVQNAEEVAERMHWILDENKIDPQACRRWSEAHSIEKTVGQVEGVYKTIDV